MAHVGTWERDYIAQTMSWSDEMFRLYGLEPDSISPSIEALFAYTHPLDRPRAQQHMRKSIQEGNGGEMEVRLVGADGMLRHVFVRAEILKDETGKSIGSIGTLTDVTKRVTALQEQTKFVSLIEQSSDFMAMASLDGVLLSMNPAGRKLVGLERVEEGTTTILSDYMPRGVWDWILQGVLPDIMRDDRWKGESQLMNVTTGQVYDTEAIFFLIRNPVSREPMCLATVQRDITNQKRLDAQLQKNIVVMQDQNVKLEFQRLELASANAHLAAANDMLALLAITDELTGAKNRRAFQEKLSEEFKRAVRYRHACSVIMLDLDNFKEYNDAYGHPKGDQVLKQVVRVLQEKARKTDLVARYGGEEFIVLLPETGKEGAMEAAERLRAAIEAQDWPLKQVTASFGVSTLSATTKAEEEMVDRADKALYLSKEAGRNHVTHADAI